jgi:4-amino-4-deoxy-L-arabinose transferase-like glycosyltransferase
MLHGARLYTDVWDNKPVGIFLVYAAITKTFGISTFAINLASAIAVFASACFVCLIGRQIANAWRPGVIAAFVLPAYMLDLGANGANTETFMMVLQSLSVLLMVRHLGRARTPQEHLRFSVVFGLLQGMLLQMKFPSIFVTAALGIVLVVYAWTEHRRMMIVLGIICACLGAFAIPTLAVFAYFAVTGGIGDIIYSNLVSPRLYVTSPFGISHPLLSLELTARRSSYFVILILFGAGFCAIKIRNAFRGEAMTPVPLLCAWVVGALLGAASSGYFRYYYFIALVAPLTLLASFAVDWLLARRRVDLGIYGSVAAVALLIAYPLSEHIRKLPQQVLSDDYRLQQGVTLLARSLVTPGTVTFYGDLNAGLYAFTDTVPATRYLQADAQVFDIPQSFGVDPQLELKRIFARNPALVMGTWQRIGPDAKYAAIISPLLAARYERVPVTDPWLSKQVAVYRLRDE